MSPSLERHAQFCETRRPFLLDLDSVVWNVVELLPAELEGKGGHLGDARHGFLEHRRIVRIMVALGAQVVRETGLDDHDLPFRPARSPAIIRASEISLNLIRCMS